MRKFHISFIILSLLTVGFSALARQELRLHVGGQTVKATDINDSVPSGNQPTFLTNFGADYLVMNSHWVPFGFGLRYDSLARKIIDGENILDLGAGRFALLVNKRILDENFFIGPIASLGFYHFASLNLKIPPNAPVTYKTKTVTSFTLGAEGGWHLNDYVVGVEGGYQYFQARSLQDDTGHEFQTASGAAKVADLGGVYGKFILGIDF